MSIFLSSDALRSFWNEHPTWVLRLTARNFNYLTQRDADPIRRPSVHACLSESLVSDYTADRWVEDGLDFAQFFGEDFVKYFDGGTFPTAEHSSGFALGSGTNMHMIGDLDIAAFAKNYSQVSGRTVMVVHQEGGDPDTATYNVHGYWRNGVNACEVYLDAVKVATQLPHLPASMRVELGRVIAWLGAQHHWEMFESVGEIYIHGERLPKRYITRLKGLGYKGIQEILTPAEQALEEKFIEFKDLPQGTASTHLV